MIFERSGRVGGKCYDINYRGTAQAIGANFVEANYYNEDSLVPWLQQYGLTDDLFTVKLTEGVWRTNNPSDPGSKLSRSQFVLSEISKLTNSTSFEVNFGFFLQTVARYVELHKELFGLYDGDLMRRPSQDVFHRIRGTILEFLTRENLLGMKPMFYLTYVMPGYGQLEETAALYGLIWFNPRLVLTGALVSLNLAKFPFIAQSFKNGYENKVKAVVEKEQLDIRFNADIRSIDRTQNGVVLETWQNYEAKTEECDFLVWTPEASQLLRVLNSPTPEEGRLLGSLKPEVYYAQLFDVEGGVRHASTTGFMENIVSGVGLAPTWLMDTAATYAGVTPAAYDAAIGRRTLYSVQNPDKEYASEALARQILRDFLVKDFNATRVEFLDTIAWSYLPRWTPARVEEGRHWDLFDMQGKDRIWYAGVSGSFDSTRSVVSYNNRLLGQMVPRNITAY